MRFAAAYRWIVRNTLVSRESLTPEIRLRLITEACPLWMSSPDECPLPDPYWAFYWPGGQALTRFLLDSDTVQNGVRVIDLGCGCGSAAIAAVMKQADQVLINDIDPYALVATRANFRLNNVHMRKSIFSTTNFLCEENMQQAVDFLTGSRTPLIILGDMFYDCDFAQQLFKCLRWIKSNTGARILVGDPDRHPLAEEKYTKRYVFSYGVTFSKETVAEYPLPGYVTREHYGFTTAKVYEIKF